MRTKLFPVLFALLLTLAGNAQDKQEGHLKFKGVEIKNSSEYLKKSLSEKGFKEKDGLTLSGQFAGYETETTILISEQGTPYAISTRLPYRLKWDEVEEDYNLFKKNITKKYGTPYGRQEEFLPPYIKGDGFETKAFSQNKAKYYCIWSLPNGTIEILIKAKEPIANNTPNLYLNVIYTDKAGLETTESMKEKAFIEDL